MLKMILMENFKNWMSESANILFDDSKNDLRSLPKSVRLQILLVLSFIWTTVFSLYVFSYSTFAFGWAGTYIAHIGLIFAVYMTFKQFHRAEEKSANVFKTKKIPYRIFEIIKRNEETMGELFTFFILETILLGRLLKVNPLNQPSVELIKKETQKILN